MTVNAIRAKVRRIVNDAASPHRWGDDELREHLQTAVRRLNSQAPHTRYVGGAVVDYVVLPGGDDDAFPVDGRYAEALALYVAYLCYFNDAADTVNAERAAACLSRAEGLMV